MKNNLKLIVCVSSNWCIGNQNRLLFSIPLDMDIFKIVTSGRTIVMGRKTYESLPIVLPNRKYVVLTNNTSYKIPNELGTTMTMDEFLSKDITEETYVIGGGVVYNALAKHCEELLITKVDSVVEGDTFIDHNITDGCVLVAKSKTYNQKEISYHFEKWQRKK